MCGINGYIRRNRNAEAVLPCISRMNRLLRHRGPDSEGACFLMPDGNGFSDVRLEDTAQGVFPEHVRIRESSQIPDDAVAAMGQRRLSIVDLSLNAHQPMSDESGRFRLVFNGEIFNYRELRQELQSRGISFFSNSDTEVLLKGWMADGPAFLGRINGFFAGCMADVRENTWTLFRDSPGVKPLFYLETADCFAFSSETPPLRALLPSVRVNAAQVASFFYFGQTLNNYEDTWFQAIKSLPPGTTLEIHLNDLKQRRNSIRSQQHPHTSGALESVLRHSILQRMVAEVPVGFAASGGLDSSLILGMAASLFPKQLPGMLAFSATSEHPEFDESNWQQHIAAHTGVNRIAVSLSATHVTLLPDLVASADLPAAAWNNLAHYRLCATAQRNDIKVMLNGQGADELMAGYPAYLPAWFRDASWKERKEFILNLDHCGLSTVEWMKLRLKDGLQQRIGAVTWQRRAIRHKSFADCLTPELSNMLPEAVQPSAHLEALLKEDYYGMKLGQMLQWEDRNSMAHSIESRNPFADDPELAQTAWDIPAHKKIHHGYTKYPLREIAQSYIPKNLSWRRDKKGFSMPDAAFTAEALPTLRTWIEALPECGVNKEKVLRLEATRLKEDAVLAGFVFRCATYSLFLQQLKS